MADLTATRRTPPSAIAIDLACLGFAAWTVLCNVLVQLQGTPQHLVIAAGVAALVLAGALAYALVRRRLGSWLRALDGSPEPPDAPAPPAHAPEPPADAPEPPAHALPAAREPSLRTRAVFLGLGLAVTIVFAWRGELIELWVMAFVFFAASYAVIARSPSGDEGAGTAAAGSRATEAGLWLIGLACAALTLSLNRSNSDDAFYANIAVTVVDFPTQPLLAYDTLHGVPGARLKIAAYGITSVELLTGLVSRLLGVETLQVYHLYTPVVMALLVPFALARLFRLLDRERFGWAVLAAVILLALDGGGGRGSFNNFAFARLFQGKAVFVTVLLPALLAYGIRFALRPTAGRLVMLAAAQIAALGMTVTAFWAAPLLAITGVLVALPLRRQSLATLAKAVASSGYLLVFGVYFKLRADAELAAAGKLRAASAVAAAANPAAPARAVTDDLLHYAYHMVLGADVHLVASLAIALSAWPLCRTPLARRFAVVVPLLFFAVAGNPWLADTLTIATTRTVHWRVLWLLPVPLLAALVASAPMRAGRSLFGVLRAAVFTLMLTLFLQYASPQLALNRKAIEVPRPKVHGSSLRIARVLIAHLPPRHQAAAPERVSTVLPMLNGYSYPLVIKPKYLSTDQFDRMRRVKVSHWLRKKQPNSSQRRWVAAQLDLYRVEGVVAAEGTDPKHSWATTLQAAGFKRVGRLHGYEVWTRRLPGARRDDALTAPAPGSTLRPDQ